MKTKEKYYRCAGYYSLPFSAVPLATVTLLECLGNALPFLFGSLGFYFAISGVRKGGWGAKLCAVVSLLMFTHIALVLVYNKIY